MYKLSASLSSYDKYKIRKLGLEKALGNMTWKNYLPIEKSNRAEGLLEKLRIRHFHLTTQKQREKGVESDAIVLFIIDVDNSLYIFHVSDTHEGFTRYAGKVCTENCKMHIKKALDTLLREKATYCRMNPNMIFFNNAFFHKNTPENSGTFFIPFEDNGEIDRILKRFIDEIKKVEILPLFTIDNIINKIGITDDNKDISEFVKSKINRKRRFVSREELLSEVSKLSYTTQNIAEKALERQHKPLKPLDKPWHEITDKDIIIAMNSEVTDFFNDALNFACNPSKETANRLERHHKR
jgi:hypothetical protein